MFAPYLFLFLFLLIGLIFFPLAPIQDTPLGFMDWYYILLIALSTIGTFWFIYKNRRDAFEVDPIMFLLILLGGYLRFSSIDLASIWLDEYTQFYYAPVRGPIAAATFEQQMPYSYLLSAISRFMFGFQEFAPRFFPALAGTLSCGAFYLLVKKWIPSQFYSITAGLLFSVSPWLVRYSVEGRPISLAVFSGILFLYVLSEIFLPKSKPSKGHIWVLASASFLLLSSTFLQNYIFLFCANIAFLIVLKPSKELAAKVLGIQLLVIVLLSPYIWTLFSQALTYTFNSLDSNAILSASNKKQDFLTLFSTTYYPHRMELFIGLFAAALAGALKLKNNDPIERVAVFSGLLFGIFAALFSVIFFIFINWTVYHRYTYIGLPVLILFIFACFYQMELFKKNYLAQWVARLLALVVLGVSGSTLYAYKTNKKELDLHPDWRGLYQVINKYGSRGDLIFSSMYDSYDIWRSHGILANEFYLKSPDKYIYPAMTDTASQALYLRSLLNQNHHPKALFLVHFWNEGYTSKQVPNGAFVFGFKGLSLMGIQTKSREWPLVLLDLIRGSRNMRPEGHQHLTFLQMEMEILLHLNKKEEATKIFAELNTYDLQNHEYELYQYYQSKLNTL